MLPLLMLLQSLQRAVAQPSPEENRGAEPVQTIEKLLLSGAVDALCEARCEYTKEMWIRGLHDGGSPRPC
jgi:hypothetical protein